MRSTEGRSRSDSASRPCRAASAGHHGRSRRRDRDRCAPSRCRSPSRPRRARRRTSTGARWCADPRREQRCEIVVRATGEWPWSLAIHRCMSFHRPARSASRAAGRRLVDDAHCLAHRRASYPARATSCRCRSARRTRSAGARRGSRRATSCADLAVDCQPARTLPRKCVRAARAPSADAAPDRVRVSKPARNDAQRAEADGRELEQGRRARIEIRVDVRASPRRRSCGVVEPARRFPRSVEPAQPGRPDRARETGP